MLFDLNSPKLPRSCLYHPLLCRCWLGICLAQLPCTGAMCRPQCSSMCSLMQQHKPHNMPQLHEGQVFAGVYFIFYVTPPVASQALPLPLPFPPCFYRCWLGVCLAQLPCTGAMCWAQCSSMFSLQQQPQSHNMPRLHAGQAVTDFLFIAFTALLSLSTHPHTPLSPCAPRTPPPLASQVLAGCLLGSPPQYPSNVPGSVQQHVQLAAAAPTPQHASAA